MNHKIIFRTIQLSLIATTLSFSQSIPLQFINGSAASLHGNNLLLNFIVGDIAVLNDDDNQNNSISSEFTSATTLTTLSVKANDSDQLNIEIYPNPTTDVLKIKFTNIFESSFYISLIKRESSFI